MWAVLATPTPTAQSRPRLQDVRRISIGSGHAPGQWPHDTAPREARTLGSSLDSDTVHGNAVAAISLHEDYLSMTPSTLSNTLFKVLASD